MRTALKRLDLPSYHGMSLIANPPDGRMWDEYLRYKYTGRGRPFTRADWDCLLGHVQVRSPPLATCHPYASRSRGSTDSDCLSQATLDVPCAACMPELIEAYPEAKVVVVERDADAWFRSIAAGLEALNAHFSDLALLWLDEELFRPYATALRWIPQMWGNKKPSDEVGMKRTCGRLLLGPARPPTLGVCPRRPVCLTRSIQAHTGPTWLRFVAWSQKANEDSSTG